MFSLNQLLGFGRVVIQCHDNPDPDAMACAYAAQRYLAGHGVPARVVYSGFAPIQKSNLRLLAAALGMDMTFIPRQEDYALEADALLLVVDGQYGAGNVKRLEAAQVAVIDHHLVEKELPALSDVRPFLGSCATLMWLLLGQEGFDFAANLDVATALYYGLYTDTGSLSEIIHPLDMDMRDSLRHDQGLLKKLRNSNLTIQDLQIAGKTLINHHLDPVNHSAVFEAEPCDPNILGFTGDLALQVDNIDACVVFCVVSGGVKLSVRSCVREIMANELAARLCEGVGSGGGHKEKAGGFISGEALEKLGAEPMEFLSGRFSDYYQGYDLVYSESHNPDLSEYTRYRKLNTPVGFVRTLDLAPKDTELIVRTLEGDTHIVASPDIYIIVGVRQEIYPIRREKFEASYRQLSGHYAPDERFLPHQRYDPTVKIRVEGTSLALHPYILPCAPTGQVSIWGRRLEKRTKVFTAWNLDGYMFGDVGDILAVRDDDGRDVYVIEQDIFAHTYTEA